MSDRTDERRKHPRSVHGFRIEHEADDGRLLEVVNNISASGVLCHTSRPVAEMTRMQMVLDLPGAEHTIITEGIVVRCTPESDADSSYRVAISFAKLTDEQFQAIENYVAQDLGE